MLTLNQFKIGDDFIETYLSYYELKEIFDKEYRDISAPSTHTRLAWFVDYLVRMGKAENMACPVKDIIAELVCT